MAEVASKYDVWELLAIAESANPPEHKVDCYWEVEMQARDGWYVSFSYDCGELDFIGYWLSPDSEKIEPWEMPESHDRDIMIAWRSVGCRARLLELHQRQAVAFVHARVGDWAQIRHEPGLLDDGYKVVAVDDKSPGRRLCVQGTEGRIWVANRNVVGAVRA